MEAFSLLKYWRGGGAGTGSGVILGSVDNSNINSRATTIVTAVSQSSVETDDDDGPFFDLEFAVPEDGDEEEDRENKKESNGISNEKENDDDNEDTDSDDDDEGTDGEKEFNFTLSSGSSNDQNLPLSPSDDLFFKGRLVPIEPSSIVINSKSQFPASFLKSATKFRVFMLGFKKSSKQSNEKQAAETNNKESAASSTSPKQGIPAEKPKQQENQDEPTKQNSKFLTVKFKVEEVPLVSHFTRDNSKNPSKSPCNAEESAAATDEKRFSKDVMQKYLNKVKPLYIRVSKRYGDKSKFSGQLSLASGLKSSAPPSTAQKSSPSKTITNTAAEKKQQEAEIAAEAVATVGNNNVKSLKQAGLRVVCKHLGKSRSASSAAAAAATPVVSKRRDDSLLQQQDGIQSAILHCKRSFNASRDSDSSSQLSRSVSDPCHEKSVEL